MILGPPAYLVRGSPTQVLAELSQNFARPFVDLPPLLGSDFSAYRAAMGEEKSRASTEGDVFFLGRLLCHLKTDTRAFEVPRLGSVTVEKASAFAVNAASHEAKYAPEPYKITYTVDVCFSPRIPHLTWQDAVSRLGIDPANVHDDPTVPPNDLTHTWRGDRLSHTPNCKKCTLAFVLGRDGSQGLRFIAE